MYSSIFLPLKIHFIALLLLEIKECSAFVPHLAAQKPVSEETNKQTPKWASRSTQ